MKKLIVLIVCFLSINVFAVIRIVPTNYAKIQLAINASANGDTVLVEPGTYFENINFRGKKIVLTSRFYQNKNLSYIPQTIVNGSTPAYADTASCVIFCSGEDSTTVIQGFTITGGSGTKWLDIHGAGVYREGGGILMELSSPVVRFNIIKNNFVMNNVGVTSTGGGGIRIGDGTPKILNNIIMNNTGKYGAGIVLNYTGCTIKNNIICYNSLSQSFGAGAGIWAYNVLGSNAEIIENNTIANNSSLNGSAGIYSEATTLTVRNNILWNNAAPGNVQISGTVNATYNCVSGGYTGAGNINLNPLWADTNFILSNSSPCIDKGDSSLIYNDVADSVNPSSAKFPSKGLLRNDMGAYGGPGASLLSLTSVIGIQKINSVVPESFNLYQNYRIHLIQQLK